MQYSIMPTCNIVICNTVILPICNILFLSIGNIVYFQYAILYCYEQFRQNQYILLVYCIVMAIWRRLVREFSHVVNIDKEKEWPQDAALWDSNVKSIQSRFVRTNFNKAFSISKVAFEPIQWNPPYTIALQFKQQNIMINTVKSLFNVNYSG